MAMDDKDIGQIIGFPLKQETCKNEHYTQVYWATHDGAGNRLPLLNRSFISFYYGGKPIEDFGFIASIEGDRITKGAYSEFEDLTETYDVVDGQFYWGSHFTTNQFNFILATDEITEKQLDDFKIWFSPGVERELILAEHPNRAIYARVATPPAISMLPFEHESKIKIAGTDYTTRTTVYRGTINLSLVADKPFWYSKFNVILPYISKKIAQDEEELGFLLSIFNEGVTLSQEDYRKIILEDGTPYLSMIQGPVFLGQDIVGLVDKVADEGKVWEVVKGTDRGAHINEYGFIWFDMDGDYFAPKELLCTIPRKWPRLYYCGTAPSKATISFTLTPDWQTYYNNSSTNEDGSKPVHYFLPEKENLLEKRYICHPSNSFSNPEMPYSYIAIWKNGVEKRFKFTTPAIYTGFNQAIKIVEQAKVNSTTVLDIIADFKATINEYYSRNWAILCIKRINSLKGNYVSNAGTIKDDLKNEFYKRMKGLFVCGGHRVKYIGKSTYENSKEENIINSMANYIMPATFTFNSETGEAVGTFMIRKGSTEANTDLVTDSVIGRLYKPWYQKEVSPGNFENENFIVIEENVGDMVCSDYLTIEERDYFISDGYIIKKNDNGSYIAQEDNNKYSSSCHILTTNYPSGLQNFWVEFKNMYY